MPLRQRPNVYTIAPDVPFLKTLAQAVLSGELLPDDFDLDDPLAFANISIYLPTQRSVRLVTRAFINESKTPSLILPNIKALGDGDEEEASFDANAFERPGDAIPQAISTLTRQIVLTRLILRWADAIKSANHDFAAQGQTLVISPSAADAAWLAADLGDLLDRATSEEISWDQLPNLVKAHNLTAFWQLSLEFLQIVTEHWPVFLEEQRLIDAPRRRDLLIAQEARRLRDKRGPVIAAGSTGTLPSTARFLSAVAHLPHGRLVLPGFDKDLYDTVSTATGKRYPTIAGRLCEEHPQYGLKQLLSVYVKIAPDEVKELGNREPTLALRTRIVSTAMLPAPVTHYWSDHQFSKKSRAKAFENVAFVNAKTDAQEALAIAVALREFVEDQEGLAALVTPDRTLARRVRLELQQWGLEVDDSAGRPLSKTALSILAQLVIDTVTSGFDPVTLLALLKHPFARFDREPLVVRRAARLLDLALLRGSKIAGGVDGFMQRFVKIRTELLRGTAQEPDVTSSEIGKRLHPALKSYTMTDWDLAEDLCNCLKKIFQPLERLCSDKSTKPLKTFSKAHFEAFCAVLSGTQLRKPNKRAGSKELEALFQELQTDNAEALKAAPYDYPKLFRAFLGNRTVRYIGREDPRILILGSLEARLLDPDFIILAALDEGSWPKPAENDPFMSRAMRAEMGLEAPERRIGLAAHDVVQGLGAKRVLLTRAAKRGGTPVVMSRWLQRLFAVLGEEQTRCLEARGEQYLLHAHHLDNADPTASERNSRPNPKPPVSARPTSLSITSVERWVRDPYAIYAELILNLKPVEPLGVVPGFAERGTIIHEVLDRFNTGWEGEIDETAEPTLLNIGRALFSEQMEDFPDQRALWWPRFERIVKAYLNFEKERPFKPIRRLSELHARLALPVDGEAFILTGKIDRIDVLSDDTLAILDFKTGIPPSQKQVKSGLSAQLPLEVLLHQRGAFSNQGIAPDKRVSELGWVTLNGRDETAPFRSATQKAKNGETGDSPDDLGDLAKRELIGLIRQYRNFEQGYMSRPRPDFAFTYKGPYDHLARVQEWLFTDQETDG